MNAWIIFALVILGFGLIFGLFTPSNFLFCLPVLALEGIIYLLTKLPAWVLAWNVGITVKIAFMAMPYLIVIGILIVVIALLIKDYNYYFDSENMMIIGGIIVGLGVLSGIVAGAFAWIPNIGWRIAAIVLIPLLIAFICVCVREICGGNGGGKRYSFGAGHPDWSSSNGWGGGDC